MSYQAVCPARSVAERSPEEKEAAREFGQALTRARTDRRAFAQILTDAFICGMEAQERLAGSGGA